MKTKFLKGILSAILLLNMSISFAQPANPDPTEDIPTANIDNSLMILIIGATTIGGYVFLRKYKKEQLAK